MSASDRPDAPPPLPLTPEEINAMLDVLAPVEDTAELGGNIGQLIERLPGPGNKFFGTFIQTHADMIDLAFSTVDMTARALQFQAALQDGGVQEAFPPPPEVARMLREDFEPLREAIESGPPFEPPE